MPPAPPLVDRKGPDLDCASYAWSFMKKTAPLLPVGGQMASPMMAGDAGAVAEVRCAQAIGPHPQPHTAIAFLTCTGSLILSQSTASLKFLPFQISPFSLSPRFPLFLPLPFQVSPFSLSESVTAHALSDLPTRLATPDALVRAHARSQ